jgi:uncharacterized protein YndB with AHSA1/START domain
MTTTGTATVTTPSDLEILIIREFAAPPALVYRAWTTPELVTRWWAGKQGTLTSVEIDLRVGGGWRYVLESDGFEIAFSGEYRELVPGERIVTTEVYEAMPPVGDPVLNVVTFAPAGPGTHLELLVVAPDTQTRDAILGSGMEVGMQLQFDLLDELTAGQSA